MTKVNLIHASTIGCMTHYYFANMGRPAQLIRIVAEPGTVDGSLRARDLELTSRRSIYDCAFNAFYAPSRPAGGDTCEACDSSR